MPEHAHLLCPPHPQARQPLIRLVQDHLGIRRMASAEKACLRPHRQHRLHTLRIDQREGLVATLSLRLRDHARPILLNLQCIPSQFQHLARPARQPRTHQHKRPHTRILHPQLRHLFHNPAHHLLIDHAMPLRHRQQLRQLHREEILQRWDAQPAQHIIPAPRIEDTLRAHHMPHDGRIPRRHRLRIPAQPLRPLQLPQLVPSTLRHILPRAQPQPATAASLLPYLDPIIDQITSQILPPHPLKRFSRRLRIDSCQEIHPLPPILRPALQIHPQHLRQWRPLLRSQPLLGSLDATLAHHLRKLCQLQICPAPHIPLAPIRRAIWPRLHRIPFHCQAALTHRVELCRHPLLLPWQAKPHHPVRVKLPYPRHLPARFRLSLANKMI